MHRDVSSDQQWRCVVGLVPAKHVLAGLAAGPPLGVENNDQKSVGTLLISEELSFNVTKARFNLLVAGPDPSLQYGCGLVCGTGQLLQSPLCRDARASTAQHQGAYLGAQLQRYGDVCRRGDMVQVPRIVLLCCFADTRQVRVDHKEKTLEFYRNGVNMGTLHAPDLLKNPVWCFVGLTNRPTVSVRSV